MLHAHSGCTIKDSCEPMAKRARVIFELCCVAHARAGFASGFGKWWQIPRGNPGGLQHPLAFWQRHKQVLFWVQLGLFFTEILRTPGMRRGGESADAGAVTCDGPSRMLKDDRAL